MAAGSLIEVPVSAAAARLGISGERVRRMLQTGRLEGRLVVGRWLISESSLDRMALELKREPEAAPVAP
jgi:hypothetical protein